MPQKSKQLKISSLVSEKNFSPKFLHPTGFGIENRNNITVPSSVNQNGRKAPVPPVIRKTKTNI